MNKLQSMTIGGILLSGVLLGGCGPVAETTEVVVESPTQTFTGTVSGTGPNYAITVNGKMTEITSRKVDLSKYVGKTATVTGEFSGTTLYVDEAK